MPKPPRARRFAAFGEDNDGELYFLDYDSGTLHTLARNDPGSQTADFPRMLSQTGLFASVKDHELAAGVIPFAINSRQWLDGATAEHWVAFPGEWGALPGELRILRSQALPDGDRDPGKRSC